MVLFGLFSPITRQGAVHKRKRSHSANSLVAARHRHSSSAASFEETKASERRRADSPRVLRASASMSALRPAARASVASSLSSLDGSEVGRRQRLLHRRCTNCNKQFLVGFEDHFCSGA